MRPSDSESGPAALDVDALLDQLIVSAEAARDRDDTANGLAASLRAWALLVADDDVRRRLRVGLLLSHFLYRSGEVVKMVEHGLALLPLLRSQGPSGELIDLLRMIALNASESQRFDVALSCAQEAQAMASERGDAARLSLAVNMIGCLFERLGDPWQAERLLQRALTLARAQADGHPVFTALNNLAATLIGKFYLLRDALPLEEASEPLRLALPFAEEAVAHPLALTNAMFSVFTLSNLGELHVLLGDAESAKQALDRAQALADAHAFKAQAWRLRFSQCELLLLQGRNDEAWAALQHVLAHADKQSNPVVHLRLHHALWRCALALGRPTEAVAHLEHYVRLERLRSVNQLRAQSELFVTRAEAENIELEVRLEKQRSLELEADALSDQLTGLSNRRELERRWPQLVQQARQSNSPLSVAMLDLDHFKQVNDRFGHAVGDRVLQVLADQLRALTRGSDLAVRIGGEEFLLVLPETTAVRASEVCERIRQGLAAYDWNLIAPDLQVTLSGGLCSAPTVPFERLRECADAALYQAKREGRNRLVHGTA